jgi:hypothetical protein
VILMILEFDVDGRIELTYDVDGGDGYDEATQEAITLRDYNLDITPLLRNMIVDKLNFLAYLYDAPSTVFGNVNMTLKRTVDGDEFKFYGVVAFDLIHTIDEVSSDTLISRLIAYVENMFTGDIESIIDVEPLKEMVDYDRSIDFRIAGVHGVGANVMETR